MSSAASVPQAAGEGLPNLFDLVVAGGPLMWPIGACSVVALAFAAERWIALRASRLGGERFASDLVAGVREGGPERGLTLCAAQRTPLARIMDAALRRARATPAEREKHVEDVAALEVRSLSANLKPLLYVYVVAPLLGLLGTVWGLILCFASIATAGAMGKPELLATGVYQALVTTAAGLAVAIPTVVAYYALKGRVERFARRTEALYGAVEEGLAVRSLPQEAGSAGP